MGARVIALQEQAEELGFSTIQDAIDAGYEVAYKASGNHQLYKPDEQELAHRAWEKERDELLEEQKELHDHLMELGYDNLAESVWHAITFIKEAHD